MEATCEFVTRFSIHQAEEISQLWPDNERRDVIEREREREGGRGRLRMSGWPQSASAAE